METQLVHIFGVLVLIALSLAAILAIIGMIWNFYKSGKNLLLLRAALKEYKKSHPEEYAKFTN